jgi:hypothetical protein
MAISVPFYRRRNEINPLGSFFCNSTRGPGLANLEGDSHNSYYGTAHCANHRSLRRPGEVFRHPDIFPGNRSGERQRVGAYIGADPLPLTVAVLVN